MISHELTRAICALGFFVFIGLVLFWPAIKWWGRRR